MPAEIIRGPVTVYVADTGTAQPEISNDPPAAWAKLGASISDDVLVMTFTDEEEETTTLDSPMVKDLHITRVALEYTVALVDMTPETFARVQNGVNVTMQAAGSGTGGYHELKLGYGFNVKFYAVLAVGPSAYDEAMVSHQYFPKARVKLNEAPTLAKSGDAMIGALIKPVYDATLEAYGVYRVQDAVAL